MPWLVAPTRVLLLILLASRPVCATLWEDALKAVETGDATAVGTLLSQSRELLTATDRQHHATLLHWAAAFGQGAAVRCLLDQGAAVDAVNGAGMTPLHNAVHVGCLEAVKALLLAGANERHGDRAGRTPLDLATGRNDRELLAAFEKARQQGLQKADCLRQAWQSFHDGKWPEAERHFRAAAALGRLRDGDYRGFSHSLRLLGRYLEAVPVSEEGFRYYRNAGNADDLVHAYAEAGDLAAARAVARWTLNRGDAEPQAELTESYPWRVGTREWELTVVLDEREMGIEGQTRFRTQGYYECYYPAEMPYVSGSAQAVECERSEEAEDQSGNRYLRVWPKPGQPAKVILSITHSAYHFDLTKLDGSHYELPESLRWLLGCTPDIDPTTSLVADLARGLKADDWRTTVANVQAWWVANLRSPAALPPQLPGQEWWRPLVDPANRGKPVSDMTLTIKIALCGATSEAICALLRGCGIAARPALGFTGVWKNGTQPGWHTWVEFYAPGLGWIPMESGVRIGTWNNPLVRLATITPEDRGGGPTTNARIFFGMSRKDGNGNLSLALKRAWVP